MRSARATGSSRSDPAPRALRHERCAEHEQQVRHDATREGAADDLGQSFVNRDERDDELGGIPERGIEKASDPRPRVLGGMLGRLADEPGEWDQSERGQDELRRLGKVGEVVKTDRERRDRQRREQDLLDTAAEPPASSASVLSEPCPSPLPENRRFVKSCSERYERNTIGTCTRRPRRKTPARYRTRSRAPTVQSTARRSSTRVPASGEPALRLRLRGLGAHLHGLPPEGVRRRDRPPALESAEATVSGFGAVRAFGPVADVRGRGRRDVREPRGRAGCRNPEFHELPRERANFRVFAVVAD